MLDPEVLAALFDDDDNAQPASNSAEKREEKRSAPVFDDQTPSTSGLGKTVQTKKKKPNSEGVNSGRKRKSFSPILGTSGARATSKVTKQNPRSPSPKKVEEYTKRINCCEICEESLGFLGMHQPYTFCFW